MTRATALYVSILFVWGGIAKRAACDAGSEGAAAGPQASAAVPEATATPEPTPRPTPTPAATQPSGWNVSGDFRLRYERTSNQQPTAQPMVFDPRHKEVVRFRGGATKAAGKLVTFGVRLATGSLEDPNSTDVTLGDFADDFEVNLDRAFLELRYKGLFLTGGRFANPFVTTELVWDGDVNPQGLAASFAPSGSRRVKPKLVGMLFIVDEQTASPDSFMAGGQAQLAFHPSASWSLVLAGGYYDYAIKSLRNADAGDTRSNRLAAGGASYVSDFDLLDAVVMIEQRGFSQRFPIRFVGNLVKNLGADDENQGFAVDLFVGRASDKGDVRFRYGYARAETDAVLAAFSHDNTTLATNYKQHTVTVDYQVRKDVQLNATWYLYAKLDAAPDDRNPWITRLRLNATVTF